MRRPLDPRNRSLFPTFNFSSERWAAGPSGEIRDSLGTRRICTARKFCACGGFRCDPAARPQPAGFAPVLSPVAMAGIDARVRGFGDVEAGEFRCAGGRVGFAVAPRKPFRAGPWQSTCGPDCGSLHSPGNPAPQRSSGKSQNSPDEQPSGVRHVPSPVPDSIPVVTTYADVEPSSVSVAGLSPDVLVSVLGPPGAVVDVSVGFVSVCCSAFVPEPVPAVVDPVEVVLVLDSDPVTEVVGWPEVPSWPTVPSDVAHANNNTLANPR